MELLLRWENDPAVWRYGDTSRAYSRDEIETLVARGERFVIEVDGRPVGTVDLYDYDPQEGSAGVGVLIYDESDRRQGYASRALVLLQAYMKSLGVNDLWYEADPSNTASHALFAKYPNIRCRGF